MEKGYNKPRQHIKKQRHHFANKGLYSQSYDFFLVVVYRCESWTIKKAECQEVMFTFCGARETLGSPLDCQGDRVGES